MPREQMQTDNIEYNRLPIQNLQSRQIEYNGLPNLTYNKPLVQASNQPIQTSQYNRLPIQNEQSRQIEYNRLPNLRRPAKPSFYRRSSIKIT